MAALPLRSYLVDISPVHCLVTVIKGPVDRPDPHLGVDIGKGDGLLAMGWYTDADVSCCNYE